MGDVAKLPVRHKQRPVCDCGRALPNFSNQSVGMMYADPNEVTIQAVTFHVRCVCGCTWDMKKTVNDTKEEA